MRSPREVGPLVVLVAITFGCAHAQPSFGQVSHTATKPLALPPTAPARHFAAFLAAYNSGTPDSLTRFVEDHFSSGLLQRWGGSDSPAGTWLATVKAYGPVQAVQVTRSDSTVINVLAYAPLTELFLLFGFSTDSTAERRIASQYFATAAAPDSLRQQFLPAHRADAREIDVYVSSLERAGLFSGVVLVAKDGHELFARGYGMANRETGEQVRLETQFSLASATKMFTSLALLKLVEEQRVSLDDTVGRFFPELADPQRRTVTIRHLLSHTAGYSDFMTGGRYQAALPILHNVSDYVGLVSGERLRFPPGREFRYSNSGYVLLGAVVERVAGEPFYDYVRRTILVPVGMRHTYACDRQRPGPSQAIGYTYRTGPGGDFHAGPARANSTMIASIGSPAEGLCSTARDLLHFANALKRGSIISLTTLAEATTSRVTIDSSATLTEGYGYGFEVLRRGTSRMVGHTGRLPGVNVHFAMYPDSGYTFIVLSNAETVGGIIGAWLRRVFGA